MNYYYYYSREPIRHTHTHTLEEFSAAAVVVAAIFLLFLYLMNANIFAILGLREGRGLDGVFFKNWNCFKKFPINEEHNMKYFGLGCWVRLKIEWWRDYCKHTISSAIRIIGNAHNLFSLDFVQLNFEIVKMTMIPSLCTFSFDLDHVYAFEMRIKTLNFFPFDQKDKLIYVNLF